MSKRNGFSLALCCAVMLLVVALPGQSFGQGCDGTAPPDTPCYTGGTTQYLPQTTAPIAPGLDCPSNNPSCNLCISSGIFTTPAIGSIMVAQIFTIINGILYNIDSTFYTGIVQNQTFQSAIGVAFVLYIAIYGVMLTFGLAPPKSGDAMERLVKIAIVYAMTTTTGWTFFATWIQTPVVGVINTLITDIANVANSVPVGNSSTTCISPVSLGGTPPLTSTATSLQLAVPTIGSITGPMSMLYGPMTCLFGIRFIAAIEALATSGMSGFLMALIVLWGAFEFILMLLGAIATFVKAIVGLTFLFGLGPIFFAFYLFEKTRALTEGWISMIAGFALQPVLLFAFLSFYSAILGTAMGSIFLDSNNNQLDICYVPWHTQSGLFTINWWRFANPANASHPAGGGWNAPNLPLQILSALYFIVLCSLGKNFTNYVSTIAKLITGGRAGGGVAGEEIGDWFKSRLFGGDD